MFTIFSDTLAITQRNLVKYTRLPQLMVFSTIQPVMFMLLFTYVFGGAIRASIGTANYISYLLPGIVVQTVLFGSMQTGVSLAEDLSRGIIDRFRSLPMTQSAILAARTFTDVVRNIFVITLMTLIGFVIGFRIEHGVLHYIAGMGIALGFGFAFSWISACIGMSVKDVETAQVAGFIWVFPLVFASSIFVPVKTMPVWLQTFARNTPITATANAVRALTLGAPAGEYVVRALAWIGLLLVIFIPLAVMAYHRRKA